MNTDGRIVGTFAAVSTVAADCGAVADQMSLRLDELKTYLNPLVGTWTGEAAERHRAGWECGGRQIAARPILPPRASCPQ